MEAEKEVRRYRRKWLSCFAANGSAVDGKNDDDGGREGERERAHREAAVSIKLA